MGSPLHVRVRACRAADPVPAGEGVPRGTFVKDLTGFRRTMPDSNLCPFMGYGLLSLCWAKVCDQAPHPTAGLRDPKGFFRESSSPLAGQSGISQRLIVEKTFRVFRKDRLSSIFGKECFEFAEPNPKKVSLTGYEPKYYDQVQFIIWDAGHRDFPVRVRASNAHGCGRVPALQGLSRGDRPFCIITDWNKKSV